MFQSVSRGSSGAVEYLLYGHRKGYNLTRNERDYVTPVYGDLNEVKRVQNYLETQKDQSDNYLHVVISYSNNDMAKMAKMSVKQKQNFKQEMVKKVIKHHTSGYDLESQVTAYAETHFPKIKKLPNDKGSVVERYEHEHILIMLHDKISNARLRTTFHKDQFIDHTFTCYLNEKYKMDKPLSVPNAKQIPTSPVLNPHKKGTPKHLLVELKDVKTYKELTEYFDKNNIKYKLTKHGKDKKMTVLPSENWGKKINLLGHENGGLHFNHIDFLVKNRHKNITVPDALMPVKSVKKDIEKMDLGELESILKSYYKKRHDYVFNERNSKKTKQVLQKIYEKKGLLKEGESLEKALISQFKMFQNEKHFEVEKPQIKIKKQEKLNGKCNLHKPSYREIRGRKTKDDMRKLSDFNFLHYTKNRTGMLLSSDERNRLRGKPKTNNRLQSTTNRTPKNGKKGTRLGVKSGTLSPQNWWEDPRFPTLQNKLFFDKYKHFSSIELEGYWVDVKTGNTRIAHKDKKIFVEDLGDKITGRANTDGLDEEVKIMLDIAISKGWRLSTLQINGKPEFIEEFKKQVEIHLKKQRVEHEKNNPKEIYPANIKSIKRPKNALEEIAKNHKEKSQSKDLFDDLKNIGAERVLKHTVDKFKLNYTNYEITDGNKINNKLNRQKPKNVIDFLQKEIGMSTKEAVDELELIASGIEIDINEPEMHKAIDDINKKSIKQKEELKSVTMDTTSVAKQIEEQRMKDIAKAVTNAKDARAKKEKKVLEAKNLSEDKRHEYLKYLEKAYSKSGFAFNLKDTFVPEMQDILKAKGLDALIIKEKNNTHTIVFSVKNMEYTEKLIRDKIHMKIANMLGAPVEKVETPNLSILKNAKKLENGKNKIDVGKVLKFETEKIERAKAHVAEVERKTAEIKRTFNEHLYAHSEPDFYALDFVDTKKLEDINITGLIKYYDDTSKYKIIEQDGKTLAMNEKTKKVFSPVTYLQMQNETLKLRDVAIELEGITGEQIIKPNIKSLETVLKDGMGFRKSKQDLENHIRLTFKEPSVKITDKTLRVGDIEVLLEELDVKKQDIELALMQNKSGRSQTYDK